MIPGGMRPDVVRPALRLVPPAPAVDPDMVRVMGRLGQAAADPAYCAGLLDGLRDAGRFDLAAAIVRGVAALDRSAA